MSDRPASSSKAFAVSIHGVAPDTWSACEQLLALTDEIGAPATLLIVPRYHGRDPIEADPRFMRALKRRLESGDDIVLHGFRHWDDGPDARTPIEWLRRRVYTASEAEFDALDEAEAARRLRAGQASLARAKLPVSGFVAPAWQIGRGCEAALRKSGIRYTSTRNHLIDIRSWRRLPAPSLVFATRSPTRIAATRLANRLMLLATSDAPLVRAALHPADAAFASLIKDWRDLLARLAASRRAILERDALVESAWTGVSAERARSVPPPPRWARPSVIGTPAPGR